ncbi:ABC transporter ATP-binding protein [Allorhizocola rhizosphaerae]|uniref:ABC transporter ATP-binding protein n=1 Tax=Allorhizocola rhizosphaerae TaxID=1872709 RepID=UPI001FE5E9D1|nr:ABC transporter ATP-binding protein [Allorhizocola rhizosphaerae]
MSDNDIEVENLVRVYGRGAGARRAVDDISFEVRHGEFFGILGPNGAGKTTTIKVLLTTLLPTAGRVSILGHDVVRDVQRVRRRIGYVLGGDKGFYDRLTARQNMIYFCDLYEVPHRVQRTRIPQLLELTGLTARAGDKVETFSRGMKQRLHIARSLVHDPRVLILDEPTSGIDPIGAREVRDLAAGLIRLGKTVLLTTHYMQEADALCDRLVVLAKGRIVASGAPRDVKQLAGISRVTELELTGVEQRRLDALRDIEGVTSVHVDVSGIQQIVRVQSAADVDCTAAIVRALESEKVERIATREPTLEDAYVALISSQDGKA